MESLTNTAKQTVEMLRTLPMRARWHAAISVCLAFVFYTIIVYPATSKLGQQKRNVEALKKQIELQTKLMPVYTKLKTASKISIPAGLPQTPGKPMPKNEVQDIYSKLSDLARKNGLLLVSAIPQPNLKSGVVNFVPVDVVARGSFTSIREFLLHASALQGFDSISHLEIARGADHEKLNARIWIVVE